MPSKKYLPELSNVTSSSKSRLACLRSTISGNSEASLIRFRAVKATPKSVKSVLHSAALDS